MQKFTASTFFEIGRYLTRVKERIEASLCDPGTTRDSPLEKGDAASESNVFKILGGIKKRCSEIGLTISCKAAINIIDSYQGGTTLGKMLDGIEQLGQTISWEMEDRLFMFIPAERAAYYDQKELFGKDVNLKFPTIQFDLVEAGNCYASGRGTAAVFHLMRIMETGVQAFGATLGVSLANEKNWQNILDEVNKKIKALPPKDQQTVMIAQASANLYAVKLAWRNEVMHPKDTYTLEEADNLIRQVKIFMLQLATII
jgi:hypothetical protein